MVTKKHLFVIGSIILVTPFVIYKINQNSSDQFTTFENLSGPHAISSVPNELKTQISSYKKGTRSRLAVLITDENSRWLDLINGLKSIGIPFIVTKDVNAALEHHTVLTYPHISGKVLSEESLKAMALHPKNGGTLIAVNVLGGGLQETFGFRKSIDGQKHKQLIFSPKWLSYINTERRSHANENHIQLAHKNKASLIDVTAYKELKNPALATYENGDPAIIENTVGNGQTFAFGIDLGQLMYLGHNYREDGMARSYVNKYEPTIDLFLRFIKNIYLQGPDALTLGTVPEGRELSIILSHDIDFAESVKNSLPFVELEKSMGVSATYFLQVKYLKDFNDKIFFDDTNIITMNEVHKKGMEIGSHSISHSRQFHQFPLGDGREVYPDYRPFVMDRLNTRDGTILGELRVSKFLIETKTNQKNLVSFRPGELSNPYSLPQALMTSGYKFSSSGTANNALTHLPYQLTYNRESKQLLPLFEFPVTIEDEEYKNMLEQLPEALEVSEAIANYGGLYTVLIHPNVTSHKLEFEKKLLAYWKNRAWIGSINDFGQWWTKRNSIEVDVSDNEVNIHSPELINGLVLNLPNDKIIQPSSLNDYKILKNGRSILLPKFKGNLKFTLFKK